MGPILNGYGVAGAFVVNALLWTGHFKSHYVALNQSEAKQTAEVAILNLLCSQPSTNVSCGQQWHF